MHRREFIKDSFLALVGVSLFPSFAFGSSDEFVASDEIATFNSVFAKLKSVQNEVGFGKFNIISFDEVLVAAKYSSRIEKFSQVELNLIEKLYGEDPSKYGFYGNKTCSSLTEAINQKDIIKIPLTGHYLFKGLAHQAYENLLRDVGSSLFLTSGVRSVSKQLFLYMNKIKNSGYNITKASKSLAPPAHSYHSIGDFDVGKKGFGALNFTEEFIRTEEFKKLISLKYVSIRYTKKNLDGVRFEPWHVQVV